MNFHSLLRVFVFFVGLSLLRATPATAQTIKVLYNFSLATNFNNGFYPQGGLVLSGDTLYGTTSGGGSFSNGVVFRINTDGTQFTNLYSFSALSTNSMGYYTNNDGASPEYNLVLSGNTLYGIANGGGPLGGGTVFRINTDGSGFTNLISLFQTGKAGPLILSSNILYVSTWGNYFITVTTDGTSTNVYAYGTGPTDGQNPQGGLTLVGNTLYGSSSLGGVSNRGTLFSIQTDGTGYTNFYNFPGVNGNSAPVGPLAVSGNTVYGATEGRILFAINTDGSSFTNLLPSYPGSADSFMGGLVIYGSTLYGTSPSGLISAVRTDGTAFRNIATFTDMVYGPQGSVVLSGNTMYGAEYGGFGTTNDGYLFSMTVPPPQLTMILSPSNAFLSWPTNAVGFALQYVTNLAGPVFWNPVYTAPVVVGTNYLITNSISATPMYYRLSQ